MAGRQRAEPSPCDYPSMGTQHEIDPVRLERAKPYSEQIHLKLAQGNHHAARQILKIAERDLEEMVEPITRATPWASLDLTDNSFLLQFANGLERHHDILTLGGVLGPTCEQLCAIPDLGKLSWVYAMKLIIARLEEE